MGARSRRLLRLAISLALLAALPAPAARAIAPPPGTVIVADTSSKMPVAHGYQHSSLLITRYGASYWISAWGDVTADDPAMFVGCRIYLQVRVNGRLIANTAKSCNRDKFSVFTTPAPTVKVTPPRGGAFVGVRGRLDARWTTGVVHGREMYLSRRLR
jgi:hypothetical protein